MSLSMKESFDNYLDYKSDIEYSLRQNKNIKDMEYFDKAVIKELYVKGLINHQFYTEQTNSIINIHKFRNEQSNVNCYYYLCIIILIILGFLCIKHIYIFNHDL